MSQTSTELIAKLLIIDTEPMMWKLSVIYPYTYGYIFVYVLSVYIFLLWVFIVIFEHIPHLFVVFQMLTWKRKMFSNSWLDLQFRIHKK